MFIEAAERFTADPFCENSGGLWKEFDRFWESFCMISAGSGRTWQYSGRRSAGSGRPGHILAGHRRILEEIWWLGPVAGSALARRKARRPYLTSFRRILTLLWSLNTALTQQRGRPYSIASRTPPGHPSLVVWSLVAPNSGQRAEG